MSEIVMLVALTCVVVAWGTYCAYLFLSALKKPVPSRGELFLGASGATGFAVAAVGLSAVILR